MKLTLTEIKKMTYAGGWDVRWDEHIPGFGVRLYPSGKKSYVLSYRVQGRKRLMVIGQIGKMALEQARREALRKLADVGAGVDPVEIKRQYAKQLTMKDFSVLYLDKYAKLHKKSWEQDERRIKLHLIPTFGMRKMVEITRKDIERLHHVLGQNSIYEANRTLALLSRMFELAISWGIMGDKEINPARRIAKFRETKRDRWVTPEEMPRLMAAIAQDENLYARQAIKLYLLTGARKSELLNAKWEDVNWHSGELRLPDTKAGRMHYIPLSDAAIELLRETPKSENNPHIFPGNVEGRPIIDIKRPWNRIRARAGLQDVRLHDLRRTVGSWLVQSGHNLPLIGKVLNHTDPKTTAIYARLADDSVRQALQEHGEKLKAFYHS